MRSRKMGGTQRPEWARRSLFGLPDAVSGAADAFHDPAGAATGLAGRAGDAAGAFAGRADVFVCPDLAGRRLVACIQLRVVGVLLVSVRLCGIGRSAEHTPEMTARHR